MLKKIVLIGAAVIAVACSSDKPKAELKTFDDVIVKKDYIVYGEEMPSKPIYKMESYNDVSVGDEPMTLALEGKIKAVCKKKGCWMKMDNPNGDDLFVSFDYVFLVPKNADGRRAIIEGVLSNDTTSVEYLKEIAKDAGKSQLDIDKITEPEISKTFLAKSVLIKRKL